MRVNMPGVVAEVTFELSRYEKALRENDVRSLNAFYWKDPLVARYTMAGSQYGHEEIVRARLARPAFELERTIVRTQVTTFGRNFAAVHIEFKRRKSGRIGRQTQAWVRFRGRWRIVSGHVSYPSDV
jgi:hypothetical protein